MKPGGNRVQFLRSLLVMVVASCVVGLYVILISAPSQTAQAGPVMMPLSQTGCGGPRQPTCVPPPDTKTPKPTKTKVPTEPPTKVPVTPKEPKDTPVPTDTPTLVPTDTSTPSVTPTRTRTSTPTRTSTATSTATSTSTATATTTATATATTTATDTPTSTTTSTATQTETNTLVATSTPTDTPIPTTGGGAPPPPPPPSAGGAGELLDLTGIAGFNFTWFTDTILGPQAFFASGLANLLFNLFFGVIIAILVGILSTAAGNAMSEQDERVKRLLLPLQPLFALWARWRAIFAGAFGGGGLLVNLLKFLLVLVLFGVIYSALDPTFSIGAPDWVWLVIATALSVGLISVGDDFAQMIYDRRRGGSTTVDVQGGNFIVAGLTTIASRFFGWAPGLIFGSGGGITGETKAEPFRLTAIGFTTMAVLALGAWLLRGLVPAGAGVNQWLATLLILIFGVGVQTMFFEMFPIGANYGDGFMRRSRVLWFVIFVAVIFMFASTQLNNPSFSSPFDQPNMRAMLIFVGLYCLACIAIILYLRGGKEEELSR